MNINLKTTYILIYLKMDNNIYAIHSILQKMQSDKRDRFFSLSNLIIELQIKHGVDILNVSEDQIEKLKKYSQIDKDDYRELSDVYETYALFNEIKNSTVKASFIKKMRPAFDDESSTLEFKEEFKKLLNVVVLVNLIRKRLRGKTVQELNDYQLVAKMTQINTQLIDFFALQQITKFTDDDQIQTFVKEEYITYDDINFEELYKLYDERYPSILELFDLFQ
jgi:hypothetical protein